MPLPPSSMQDACFAIGDADCLSRARCPDCVADILVRQARCTRRSARRFSGVVDVYSAEMPRLLDAFHGAMDSFREMAKRMGEAPSR